MISALRYEWRRIKSIRSTWIMSAVVLVQTAGFVLMVTAASDAFSDGQIAQPSSPTTLSQLVPFIFLPIFPVLLSIIAAQAFGHDYRHGTIRLTLSAFPRRWNVLLARVMMALGFLFVLALLSLLSVVAVVTVRADITGGWDWSSVSGTGSRLLAFVALYLLLVMALVILTRNLALGIVLPMVSMLIVENIVWAISSARESWGWIGDVLPTLNAINWVTIDPSGDPMFMSSTPMSIWPMVGFTAVALAAAVYRFVGRDA